MKNTDNTKFHKRHIGNVYRNATTCAECKAQIEAMEEKAEKA